MHYYGFEEFRKEKTTLSNIRLDEIALLIENKKLTKRGNTLNLSRLQKLHQKIVINIKERKSYFVN